MRKILSLYIVNLYFVHCAHRLSDFNNNSHNKHHTNKLNTITADAMRGKIEICNRSQLCSVVIEISCDFWPITSFTHSLINCHFTKKADATHKSLALNEVLLSANIECYHLNCSNEFFFRFGQNLPKTIQLYKH